MRNTSVPAISFKTFGNPNASVTDVDRISEIAHKHNTIVIVDNTFGFSSQAHLTKFFKKMRGVTPSAFRQKG